MKVYVVYAKIPSTIFTNEIINLVSNKDKFIKEDDSDNFIGIYAWSKNENYVNEFLKYRKHCKFYIKKKMKIDKYEFDEFKKIYEDDKLKYYKYERGDYNSLPPVEIMSTRNEYETVTNGEPMQIFERQFNGYFTVDYIIFKNKIIDALDELCYTSYYDMVFGGNYDWSDEEDIDHRIEYASYNASYNLTVNGKRFFDFDQNEFMIFIMIFQPLILNDNILSL